MKEECSEKEELLAAKELQLEQISVIEEELADLKVRENHYDINPTMKKLRLNVGTKTSIGDRV